MGEEDRGGLPDFDLDPTRPDFCRDIIPLKISRLSEYTADMGEEDRGGLPDPDLSKNRGGHLDLDLDPTRPDFCRDIIPLEISRT